MAINLTQFFDECVKECEKLPSPSPNDKKYTSILENIKNLCAKGKQFESAWTNGLETVRKEFEQLFNALGTDGVPDIYSKSSLELAKVFKARLEQLKSGLESGSIIVNYGWGIGEKIKNKFLLALPIPIVALNKKISFFINANRPSAEPDSSANGNGAISIRGVVGENTHAMRVPVKTMAATSVFTMGALFFASHIKKVGTETVTKMLSNSLRARL